MNWRVGLIDSCGTWSGAVEAAAFVSDGSHVERVSPASDPTGHGSRIAALLTEDGARVELLLAQVFLTAQPASAAVVAAAVDWTVSRGAKLIHLSLGLATDRAVLRAAVARAMDSGIVTVAAMPARGAPVYPAAYPSVIGGTGDARCGPGEISVLGPRLFGGCAATAPGRRGGASVGAAWVSKAISSLPAGTQPEAVLEALREMACHVGPERHREPFDLA
ncbi:MAG: hypothetical protein ABSD02_15830 [Steroidobacteraceae bacterium]|jgi:subtilisin family serine protease